MDRRKDGEKGRQPAAKMLHKTFGSPDRYTDGQTDCMYERMDGRTDTWIDGQMDGQMDGLRIKEQTGRLTYRWFVNV